MSCFRYFDGSVLVRIHDLFVDDGLSTFCAAVPIVLASYHILYSANFQREVEILTPPLLNSNLLLSRQFSQLHPKRFRQDPLRLLKNNLELPRPLLAKNFIADIDSPDRLARVFTRKRESHKFLHHHVCATSFAKTRSITAVILAIIGGRWFRGDAAICVAV